MPRLVEIAERQTVSAHCFLCARGGGEAFTANNTVFYDESVGRFDTSNLPRLCDGHKESVSSMTIEQRKRIYKDFPIAPPARVRFNAHSTDECCGFEIPDGTFDSLACMRIRDHAGDHEIGVNQAAALDAVLSCCRQPIGSPHAEWCEHPID